LSLWRNTQLALQLAEGSVEKLRLVAIRLLVPTASDCALYPLPPALVFLYYPLRPFGFAYRAGRSLLQQRLPASP
jgi:hypothetical protein